MRLRTSNNRVKASARRKHRLAYDWRRFRINSSGIHAGAYAWGCRGHPGVVTAVSWDRSNPWSSDCRIKSVIDGVEESCSIYHCAPQAISRTAAMAFRDSAAQEGMKRATLRLCGAGYRDLELQWWDADYDSEYKRNAKSLADFLGLSDEDFAFYREHNPDPRGAVHG